MCFDFIIMVVGDFTVSYPCRQENGEKLECEVAISLYILKDTDGREDYRRSVISCMSNRSSDGDIVGKKTKKPHRCWTSWTTIP